MKKQRKRYTPEEKVAILRRHLLEKEPISKLCDEVALQPTVFYRWQKELFENGAAAFEQIARPNHSAGQERIAYLKKKIRTKDEVLAELMAEHELRAVVRDDARPRFRVLLLRSLQDDLDVRLGHRLPDVPVHDVPAETVQDAALVVERPADVEVRNIWHKSLKRECIRPGTPLSLDDARRLVSGYVDHYNNVRLNSATGYITPKDMLAGRRQYIHAERDRKLEAARKQRQISRKQAA